MMRKAIIISLVWAILAADSMVNCAVNITSFFEDVRHGNNYPSNAAHPPPIGNMMDSNISQIPLYNNKTSKFYVNGSTIPEVEFDAGPSYAGNLDVGDSGEGELFFWFWPTTHPNPDKSILIWLTGGPGCSSMLGLFDENGPILWQPGTWKPVRNYWSWHRLTNVVYIDQPIGTGFSTGNSSALNEDDVAEQFMGFWRNFVDVFDLHGYEVYVTGESYAGMYCPYIGSHFLDQNDTQYFNLSGMLLYDSLIGDRMVQGVISAAYHVDYWSNVMPLNQTTMDSIHRMSADCGYNDYVDHYLTFPPPGTQPAVPPGTQDECPLFLTIFLALRAVSPSWDIYQISQLPPMLSDPLNVFNLSDREPWLNRADVKKAINAPDKDWVGCLLYSPIGHGTGFDDSEKPIVHVLPKVVDATKNVIISHAMNDFIFNANGTLLTLQNMTWGGQLGFQSQPNSPLFVPYQDGAPSVIPPDPNVPDIRVEVHFTLPASGVLGTTHTERGLTWNLVMNAGHMTPMFQPALAYRQVEVLLGRVSNMSSTYPFVISPNGSTEGARAQPGPDELGPPVGPILGRVAAEGPDSSYP